MSLRRAPRHPRLTPASRVAVRDVMAACNVLNAQQLSIYQRLYRDGLTEPGFPAGPFGVRRSVEHLGCVEIVPLGYEAYKFLMLPAEDPELVLSRAEAMFNAINSEKPLVDLRACCPVAALQDCVCVVSFKCAIHGSRCVGSHD